MRSLDLLVLITISLGEMVVRQSDVNDEHNKSGGQNTARRLPAEDEEHDGYRKKYRCECVPESKK